MDYILYCIVGVFVSAVVLLLFFGVGVVYIHGARWLEKRQYGGVVSAGDPYEKVYKNMESQAEMWYRIRRQFDEEKIRIDTAHRERLIRLARERAEKRSEILGESEARE